jgi:hypothetical protein
MTRFGASAASANIGAFEFAEQTIAFLDLSFPIDFAPATAVPV